MKRSLPHGAALRARATWRALLRLTATGGLLLSLFTLGCAGSLDPGVGGGGGVSGGGGMPGTPGCEAAIFTGKCVFCHSTAGPSGGLDLQAADIASRLVGKPASVGKGGACDGMGMLLDAGSNPATGIFINKITLMDGDPKLCGATMPQGGTLSSTELTCLTTWATSVTK
jgi:hypothetical protein